MVAYRRVYDSRHLPADCQEPGSAPEPYIRSAIEYGLPCYFLRVRFVWRATRRLVNSSGVLGLHGDE